MDSINKDIKNLLEKVNKSIKRQEMQVMDGDKSILRNFVNDNVGTIEMIQKLTNEELLEMERNGGVAGVDGSVNRAGGSYPHFIEIYQAMAKSTVQRDNPAILSQVYTPILDDPPPKSTSKDEEVNKEQRNTRLATIEAEAGIKSVKEHRPYALIMDGGLIRYHIYAAESWKKLVELCEETGTILIGVIKDIKTSSIGDRIKEDIPQIKIVLYDRELLFGLLEYGEFLIVSDEINKKQPMLGSGFIRSSLSPMAIGIDIIHSQKHRLKEMARLVLTLTPENSRGVPLWLDIIDKEVKISDDMMKAMLERYLDRGVYEKYFVSEREKRS
ncbi:MAG: DNA double-strand break repair nuclease NurA [Gudongella sp.]|nr:DNA double-strand break repair nuclease NurA [Gudongella sp.]